MKQQAVFIDRLHTNPANRGLQLLLALCCSGDELPLPPAVRRKQREFPLPRLSWIQRAWTSHVEHREGSSCRRCLPGTSLAWTSTQAWGLYR
jgi:hypothetical protein